MQEEKTLETGTKKRKNKKKKNFLYLYLFLIVFIIALSSFSYLVKSYSPNVDVAIGNNDSLSITDSDLGLEIKSVDERLKWIQMEDEMPTVALRDSDKNQNPMNIDFLPSIDNENIENELRKQEEKKKEVIPLPAPTISDIKVVRPDFRTVVSEPLPLKTNLNGPISLPEKPQKQIIPLPVQVVTKVYMGSYPTIEEAMSVQEEISSRDASISPFVKSINGSYIVQLGSFQDRDKALSFVQKLKDMGYSPKLNTLN